MGAQMIAERSKFRDLLLKEIRQTNAAATILGSVANTHIGMKRQHITRMREEYEQERQNFLRFLKACDAGTVPPQQKYDFKADFQTLNAPHSVQEQLSRLVFDELSASGAELFVTPLLFSSLQSLKETLQVRNELCVKWERAKPEPFPFVYFGVPHDNKVDERFCNAVEAIFSSNDDVIAFSIMLADSLQAHAQRKRDLYNKKFGGGGPGVNKLDFSTAQADLPEKSDDLQHFAKILEIGRPVDQLRLHLRLWRKLRASRSGGSATAE
jgi:hypothetical protein